MNLFFRIILCIIAMEYFWKATIKNDMATFNVFLENNNYKNYRPNLKNTEPTN